MYISLITVDMCRILHYVMPDVKKTPLSRSWSLWNQWELCSWL